MRCAADAGAYSDFPSEHSAKRAVEDLVERIRTEESSGSVNWAEQQLLLAKTPAPTARLSERTGVALGRAASPCAQPDLG